MNRMHALREKYRLEASRFRGPGATRTLITIFFAGIVVAAVAVAAGLASEMRWPIVAVMAAGLLPSMYCWTMLRAANHAKDTTPDAEVDEYERRVLDTWRGRALKAYSALTGIGGMAFVMAGALRDAPDSTALMAAGYFMLFTVLIVYPLPMVGFATTFNRNEEDIK